MWGVPIKGRPYELHQESQQEHSLRVARKSFVNRADFSDITRFGERSVWRGWHFAAAASPGFFGPDEVGPNGSEQRILGKGKISHPPETAFFPDALLRAMTAQDLCEVKFVCHCLSQLRPSRAPPSLLSQPGWLLPASSHLCQA